MLPFNTELAVYLPSKEVEFAVLKRCQVRILHCYTVGVKKVEPTLSRVSAYYKHVISFHQVRSCFGKKRQNSIRDRVPWRLPMA